jgi:hypothetical protein
MNDTPRPTSSFQLRVHSLRRSAGTIRGTIFPTDRVMMVHSTSQSTAILPPYGDDQLLSVLGGDRWLRDRLYEKAAQLSSEIVVETNEVIDVHLPFGVGRDGANWQYLEVRSDDQGRIWVEDREAPVDRTEYWLSLGSLALSGASLEGTNCTEGNWFDDASVLASWYDSPGPRRASYNPCFRAVSAALQRALRSLAEAWLSQEQNLEDEALAQAWIVFLASPVRTGRTRTTFVPDVLGSRWGTTVRHLEPEVTEVLTQLHDSTGLDIFNPQKAPKLLASVINRPNAYRRLLMEQASLLETFIMLAEEARACRVEMIIDAQTALQHAGRIAQEFAKELRIKLRRFAPELDPRKTAPTVLVGVSRALSDELKALAAAQSNPAPETSEENLQAA